MKRGNYNANLSRHFENIDFNKMYFNQIITRRMFLMRHEPKKTHLIFIYEENKPPKMNKLKDCPEQRHIGEHLIHFFISFRKIFSKVS